MSFLRRRRVLLVFDNVDHYVDIEAKRMTRSVSIFIEALLSETVSSRAVFTCRPTVEYDHRLAFSCHLEGLSLDAATELFRQRAAQSAESEIRQAHELTNGHAFWLDLLAAQVVRPNQTLTLKQLLDRLDTGTGLIPDNTLHSIWKTLLDRDRTVLRAIAETVRPETENQIADYVRGELNYNKATRAIRALRALNLIVVKPRIDGEDLLELHPIVRRFVRGTFSQPERLSFINSIRRAYREWIATFRPTLQQRPTLSTLQHWTQTAELDVEAGSVGDALNTLAEVSSPFSLSAFPREFCRAAQLVFSKVQWESDYSEVEHFDTLVEDYSGCLAYLGEYQQASELLDRYADNVKNKDARYIRYCGMRCTVYWIAGEFSSAVTWGRLGCELKQRSDVDTKYDIQHALALAERDAGRPDAALPVFLSGRSIEEVADPSEFDGARGGPHYGNIGRCLQFMGQLGPALICYRKSALAIEKSQQGEHIRNQAYVRMWIGEVLAAMGEFKTAAVFLAAARAKWEQVGPPRVPELKALEEELQRRLDPWRTDDSAAETTCVKWIFARGTPSEAV